MDELLCPLPSLAHCSTGAVVLFQFAGAIFSSNAGEGSRGEKAATASDHFCPHTRGLLNILEARKGDFPALMKIIRPSCRPGHFATQGPGQQAAPQAAANPLFTWQCRASHDVPPPYKSIQMAFHQYFQLSS